MSTPKTLDYLAVKIAQEMVTEATSPTIGADPKDLENLVTRALGVLQAQGVYALYLYLYSQSGEKKPIQKAAACIVAKLWKALEEEPVKKLFDLSTGQVQSWGDMLKKKNNILRQVAESLTAELDTLLLIRDLYEQTLIYARYHAKTLDKDFS